LYQPWYQGEARTDLGNLALEGIERLSRRGPLPLGAGRGAFLQSSFLDPRPVTTHNDWTRAALVARRFEGWVTFEDLVATVSFERASWGRG
jgi:hypothetical protein